MALTPPPPYVAVIFTNHKVVGDDTAYDITADRMLDLAQSVDGFLGIESVQALLVWPLPLRLLPNCWRHWNDSPIRSVTLSRNGTNCERNLRHGMSLKTKIRPRTKRCNKSFAELKMN